MDIATVAAAAITSILGGSGLVMGLLNIRENRRALKVGTITAKFKRIDEKLENDYQRFSEINKRLGEIQKGMTRSLDGLALGLVNDKIIFEVLRSHKINGESERQDQKIDEFVSDCIRRPLFADGKEV